MNKPTVAVFSFVAGIGVCFLASRWISPSAALQNTEVPIGNRSVYKNIGSRGFAGGAIRLEGAVPTFAPLESTPVFEDAHFSDEPQVLDGMDCRGCSFDNVTLKYGGGAYNIEDARFYGTTTLTLTGAAANTEAFLELMQRIANGTPGVPSASNPHVRDQPIKKQAAAKEPMTEMNVTAPYIGHM